MASIKIKSDGINGSVSINDVRVPDVRSYSIKHEAGKLPVFNLDVLIFDLTFDGNGFVPELPEVFKSFYTRMPIS